MAAGSGTRAQADCPECGDTGWRVRTCDGARRAERCDCWRAGVARQMLARARIPARYAKCGFSTFVTYDNERLQRALRKAREFAAAFPVVDKGLLFIGPPGIGKTHVAVAVLREVVLKGMRGVYYDTRSLLSAIRSTYNPVTRASEADVLEEVMRAELLVLDDLGAERLTDWVEETMHLVVNTRYNEKRPTVFTTNYEDVADVENLDSLLVFVDEAQVGAHALAEQFAQTRPHQSALALLVAVPADDLVREALAATAHQVAVGGGADADAGRAAQARGGRGNRRAAQRRGGVGCLRHGCAAR